MSIPPVLQGQGLMDASRNPGEVDAAKLLRRLGGRSIVFVGLMGAGKSCIGKRLAQRLALPFVDADTEIEAAAGCSIADIFALHGEAAFRDGERRVIARLLEGPTHVLATGGGAFCDPLTRARIRERGVSVWLRADVDLLLRRVGRRTTRPLLNNGDMRATLERLLAERGPIYAEADLAVDTADGPPDETAGRVLAEVREWFAAHPCTAAETVP